MKKWKTIKHFKNVVDDIYQVSFDGEVREKDSKKIIHKKIANKKHHPYYAVNLSKTSGKKEWVLVHQLVATFFVKVPSKYKGTDKELVPDHLDNNGLNNHYTNLEWKTRGENVQAAFRDGWINNSGANNNCTTLSELEVRTICVLLEEGKRYDYIINEMCLPKTKQMRQTLVRIKNRIAWNSISKDYKFNEKEVQYTITQLDTISKLPEIRKLIKETNLNNHAIVDKVWGKTLSKAQRETKSQTVSNIRRNKIFKNIK